MSLPAVAWITVKNRLSEKIDCSASMYDTVGDFENSSVACYVNFGAADLEEFG